MHILELNKRVAVSGTRAIGTMTAFYGCIIYSLLPLLPIFVVYQQQFLYYSNVAQLALLPLIMVNDRFLSAESARDRDREYEALMQKLNHITQLLEKQGIIIDGLNIE